MNRSRKSAVVGLVVGLVAVVVVSMWVSWTALSDLAKETGLEKSKNGFPLVVDGMILLAVGAALLLRGRKGYGWAIGSIIGYTLASLVLNFLHALGDGNGMHFGDWARVSVVAAAPVLTNALGTHLVVLVLRQWDQRPPSEDTRTSEPGVLRAARTFAQVKGVLTAKDTPRYTPEDTPQGHPEASFEDAQGHPEGHPQPSLKDAQVHPQGRREVSFEDASKDTQGRTRVSSQGQRRTSSDTPQGHPEPSSKDTQGRTGDTSKHSAGTSSETSSEDTRGHRAASSKDTQGHERESFSHLPDDELAALANTLPGPISVRRIAKEFGIGKDRAGRVRDMAHEQAQPAPAAEEDART